MRIVALVFTVFISISPFAQTFANEMLKIEKVTEDVYAIVGEMSNRSAENLGNNATFGMVVTNEGVVLIDSGGTFQGAKQIDLLIKMVSDKPVVKVINTGGQDHRWLGNGYFKSKGAQIIASKNAVNDQKERVQDQFIGLRNLIGEVGVLGTEAVYADTIFDESLNFSLGKTEFELHHVGQAHTPGDAFVWLPQKNVMFTGDIVYVERMLGVGTQSNSKSWIGVYKAMAAYSPKYLIPGHGRPTNLLQAEKDSLGYLTYLRKSVSEFMDSGGDISEISLVDQSKFSYLLNYKLLSGRNAQQVFTEIEWE